jgi:ubiquinone/menaquinone biosynthesis C-methylase UbiE
MVPSGDSGRRRWEQRWVANEPSQFQWHLDQAPPQLVELLDDGRRREGAALDLGCGAGEATRRLAETFSPAVGIDIAAPALSFARAAEDPDRIGEPRSWPVFTVADATALPFRSEAFTFVFDRGCLQSIPPERWGRCLHEVARVLRAGGEFQLLISKSVESGSGPRARLASFLRRGSLSEAVSATLSEDVLLAESPTDLENLRMEHFPFVTANGRRRDFIHALFRKVLR